MKEIRVISDQTGHGDGSVWLHLANLKKLAKILKNVVVVKPHGGILECLSRAAGYSHYDEVVHQPKPLHISLEDWIERLAEEFELPAGEILSTEEAAAWYDRLFVRRGRTAAQARSDQCQQERLARGADFEIAPARADHEQTIVDSIQHEVRYGTRRFRRDAL